jgi:ribose 5-phosphate isomerase B
MHLFVGSDHAGFRLKESIVPELRSWGHTIEDLGCYTEMPVDFPDIARAVCHAVREHEGSRGLMVCGTGVGAAIAANKITGIRAAVCHDVHSAHQAVEHDDVNVLCLGAQIVGEWLALDLIRVYCDAQFELREPFLRRIALLRELEQESARELLDERHDWR